MRSESIWQEFKEAVIDHYSVEIPEGAIKIIEAAFKTGYAYGLKDASDILHIGAEKELVALTLQLKGLKNGSTNQIKRN